MSTKIHITGDDGGVPSEIVGMRKIFELLARITHQGDSIDEILQRPNGWYVISPELLNPVWYNPATGEVIISEVSLLPSDGIEIAKCYNRATCFQGCGCNCWVDRGWKQAATSEIPQISGVHCKASV